MTGPVCVLSSDIKPWFNIHLVAMHIAKRFVTLWLVLWCSLLTADDTQVPLYEQEPFDQIKLNNANGNQVLKVRPLDLPNRRVPPDFNKGDPLEFYRYDNPHELLTVDRHAIVTIELFENLVLKKANSLTGTGQFDEAYWHYYHLTQNYPNTENLNARLEGFLVRNAGQSFQAKDYLETLALLREAQTLNPQKEGLSKRIGIVLNRLIEQHFKKREYWQARELLENNLNSSDPDQVEVYERWQTRLQAEARQRIERTQTAVQGKDFKLARTLLQQAKDIWPTVAGAQALSTRIAREYPVVVVGVAQPLAQPIQTGLVNWSGRRAARLLTRQLVEFSGSGAEGGEYFCPWGTLTPNESGTSLELQLRQTATSLEETHPITSLDLAAQLLDMAKPSHKTFNASWASLLQHVRVKSVLELEIQFQRAFVRPEAFLVVDISQETSLPESRPRGPFVLGAHNDSETVYQADPSFPLYSPVQPREIIEVWLQDTGQLANALQHGVVDVVDRLNPLDVVQLEDEPDIVVNRYDLPTIHVLIPNSKRNPFLANRFFRRAIAYAIQRDVILKQLVLGGTDLEGCQLISGPFPAGFTSDDPLGYAYNPRIEPRPFLPFMALTLFRVGINQTIDQANQLGQTPPTLEPLILAHPDTAIARLACEAISKQLGAAQVPCTLHLLPPGVTTPTDDYDLLYQEWLITEPVVDAGRLFGPQALLSDVSPYLSQMTRRLANVNNWGEARECLYRIHQIVYDETAVVPLWQIAEYFAYHQRLHGLDEGNRLVHLYQNVENWKIIPQQSE